MRVIAGIQDIHDALPGRRGTFGTSRFAWFRGDEDVPGKRVILNLEPIAYTTEIPGP